MTKTYCDRCENGISDGTDSMFNFTYYPKKTKKNFIINTFGKTVIKNYCPPCHKKVLVFINEKEI